MASTLFRSRRVVFPEGLRAAAIFVRDGRIECIEPYDAAPPADQTHDLGDLAILPGLVDPHVHVNAPGRTEWEGFPTATRAAAAGGITTLIDMPLNCLPETTTVEALTLKRASANGQTHIDWRPWGGAVGTGGDGNQGHLLPLAQAGVAGFKAFLIYPGCEGLGPIDEATLRATLPSISQSGLPLLVHAELPGPLEAIAPTLRGADWTQHATHLAGRPDEAELSAIRLLIALCREFRTRMHIVHLSSAQALPLLRAARKEGLPLTVETCPHYLHFTSEGIPSRATQFKCAPPIRSAANREQLWQGLAEGIIDLIASDHSPCPPSMKRAEEGSFLTAWGGIASLSLGLPIVWTEARQRSLALHRVAAWMSTKPAALAGLSARKGAIAEGLDADFVFFDPDATFQVTEASLHTRHLVSPYLGETLHGVVRQTILRGTPVYIDGRFPNPAHGREAYP